MQEDEARIGLLCRHEVDLDLQSFILETIKDGVGDLLWAIICSLELLTHWKIHPRNGAVAMAIRCTD